MEFSDIIVELAKLGGWGLAALMVLKDYLNAKEVVGALNASAAAMGALTQSVTQMQNVLMVRGGRE